MNVKVPFGDLTAQYLRIKDELDTAVRSVIEDNAFVGGSRVSAFEEAFACKTGAGHCVGVSNGTDAIYCVLRMLGIGPGDEVITTAHSWIASSEVISECGAKPVFVDTDEYFHIDPAAIESRITDKTRAIIAVHLFGQACDLDMIEDICKRHNLQLIEDCAQAHMATWRGKHVGSMGVAGTFSFYPGKNLGAYGDAGAVITGDPKLAESIRMYRNHGALIKHQHKIEGRNSRLDGLQAAILSVKLPYLEEWTCERRVVAELYDRLLTPIEQVTIPQQREHAKHVFHLYVIRVSARDALRDHLANSGIQTGIHYPTALPLLEAYKYLDCDHQEFKSAVGAQHEILSLPIFPELDPIQVRYVADSIQEFFS